MSRFAPQPQVDAYGRYMQPPPLPPLPVYDSTGKKCQVIRGSDPISHLVLDIVNLVNQVNLDIIQTEAADDTPDVELTDEDLLLTPTAVLGFSLNDKIWCTFSTLSQFTPRTSC